MAWGKLLEKLLARNRVPLAPSEERAADRALDGTKALDPLGPHAIADRPETTRASQPRPWQRLIALGLSVRATTLLEGLRGASGLSVGDVALWAQLQVAADADAAATLHLLAEIPPSTGNDDESLARAMPLLIEAASGEDADATLEARKWRLLGVIELLENVEAASNDPDDPIWDDFQGSIGEHRSWIAAETADLVAGTISDRAPPRS